MLVEGRLKVEETELDFDFEVLSVQFNRVGRYVLVLTVENPLLGPPGRAGEGVRLRVNHGGQEEDEEQGVLQTNAGRTEAIEQTEPNEVCTCSRNRFIFTLPKGFCKNDQDHDVRLKVEAWRVGGSDDDLTATGGTKAGEGFFAIYPRTNTPRINLYVGRYEELYRYSGVMALLRVHNHYLSMHCGRLAYTVSFHEARPFWRRLDATCLTDPLTGGTTEGDGDGDGEALHPGSEALTSTPSQPQTQLEQRPAVGSEVELPSSPEDIITSPPHHHDTHITATDNQISHSRTPQPFPYSKVNEDPSAASSSLDDLLLQHVSSCGSESVVVTLHGAVNLPTLSDGQIPRPFAVVRGAAVDPGRGSVAMTHSSQQPTQCPLWRESVSVQLHDDVLVLDVADSRTKELLVQYRLPVGCLQPFQHYHLELVQSGVRLYVTVVRKVSSLPRQPHFSFTGFEVLLKAMETPLKDPVGSLIAVARIVPNYHSYRDSMLLCSPSAAGVTMTSVSFPHPPESAFHHPPHLSEQGRPQISRLGSSEHRPVWNHSFLFLERDCATMFSGTSALVLEFYPATDTVMEPSSSSILSSSVGFSVVPLDQTLYRRLLSESCQLRLDALPLRASSLQTSSDRPPAVSVALRLMCSERPDPWPSQLSSLLVAPESMEEREDTPLTEADQSPGLQTQEEEGEPPIAPPPCPAQKQRRSVTLETDGYKLPSYDALAKILPDYQYLFQNNHTTTTTTEQQDNTANHTHTQKRPTVPDFENGARMQEISALQTQEVENYRQAMSKMAEDILVLRTQVSSLETENSQLRSDLSLHQDLGRDLLDDTDVDVMTKTEIIDRIADLKFKLASETTKAAAHKDKIQQLQNELIRKNDSEKDLLVLQKVHKQQQVDLQHLQTRLNHMESMERTVKQQQKVIEKMEKALDNRLREKHRENVLKNQAAKIQTVLVDSRKEELESALVAENARLRGELESLREQNRLPIIIQPTLTQVQETMSDEERLKLLSKLEQAEAKIKTLESQLEDNSKLWGRQKQEMLTKLNEFRHGFA